MKWFTTFFAFLLTLIPVSFAHAQSGSTSLMLAPDSKPFYNPESQAYTYVVKDDGTTSAYLRIDGVAMPKAGGVYELTLPDNQIGEVKAWYRENGCALYRGDLCVRWGGNTWNEVNIEESGHDITLKIPTREVDNRDIDTPITLGLSYKTSDVTNKKWWGREVAVTTAKSKELAQSVSIGVYLPDGVYARDKQNGPSGWSSAVSEVGNMAAAPKMMDSRVSTTAIDSAGSGQINTYRNNIEPGEDYTFRFMSATSMWKLFYPELSVMLGWVAGVAVVLSLLLYFLIGKKPWWWYVVIMSLLVALFVLIMGMWVTLRFGVGGETRGGGYPTLMKSTMEIGGDNVVPPDAPTMEAQ